MPFFTIIIPTFNSAATLRIALDSVVRQTFSNFEILIIDGVSADETLSIARSYNDSRIRIFSEKDKGIYDAMNKGLQLAEGEWLYFLGSDDWLMHDDVLERVQENLQYCDFLYGNAHTCWSEHYDGPFSLKKLFAQNICHQAIFYKAKKIKGKKFKLEYKIHSDWDMNLKMFLNSAVKKTYLDIQVAFYSDNGFSQKNSIDEDFRRDKFSNTLKYFLLLSWCYPHRIERQVVKDMASIIYDHVKFTISSRYPEINPRNPILNSLKYIVKKKIARR